MAAEFKIKNGLVVTTGGINVTGLSVLNNKVLIGGATDDSVHDINAIGQIQFFVNDSINNYNTTYQFEKTGIISKLFNGNVEGRISQVINSSSVDTIVYVQDFNAGGNYTYLRITKDKYEVDQKSGNVIIKNLTAPSGSVSSVVIDSAGKLYKSASSLNPTFKDGVELDTFSNSVSVGGTLTNDVTLDMDGRTWYFEDGTVNIGNFVGVGTRVVVTDASGNLSTSTLPTPTLQDVITAGNVLTTTNTIDAGNFQQTFSGTQASIGQHAFAFRNISGNGGAITASSSGTSATIAISNSNGTCIDISNSSAYGLYIQTTSGTSIYANSNGAHTAEFLTNRTSTNDIQPILKLYRTSTSAASAGIGGSIDFHFTTSIGGSGVVLASKIISKLTTATSGSEVSKLEFWGINGGFGTMAVKMAIAGNGLLTLSGYGSGARTGTATYTLQVDASGNIIEGTPSTISTLQDVINNGSVLSLANTITAGNNSQTFSGTQAAGVAYTFSNTGNGTALSATANGSGIAAIINNTSSGTALFASSTNGIGGYFSSTNNMAIFGKVNPASTNNIATTFMTGRNTSGTADIGLGSSWDMQLEDAAGTDVTAFSGRIVLTTATGGSAATEYQIFTLSSGALTQKFTIKSSGQIQFNGYGSGTKTGTASNFLQVDSSGNVIEGNALAPNPTGTTYGTGNPTFCLTQAMGGSDWWKIYGESTGSDGGQMVIETGDNGTEPIIFRFKETSGTTTDITWTRNVLGFSTLYNYDIQFGGANKFRFATNGDFHAANDIIAFSTTWSDLKLKTDIKPLESSLDKVKQLSGVSFNWNTGRVGRDIGFIAQEVEKIVPEVVREKKDTFFGDVKTVNYQALVAVLVEAIKEQQVQIDELKNKLV
jgi:hypothetical protein